MPRGTTVWTVVLLSVVVFPCLTPALGATAHHCIALHPRFSASRHFPASAQWSQLQSSSAAGERCGFTLG